MIRRLRSGQAGIPRECEAVKINPDVSFFLQSIMLGVGLAMDAFSVFLANGLNEPCMKKGRMSGVAGVFSAFQFAMPLIGWICVSAVAQYFKPFERCIPWIALILLSYIGGKMLLEGRCGDCPCEEKTAMGLSALLCRAWPHPSARFTIADYRLTEALLACLLIGAVTFFVCFAGSAIGKHAGTRLAGRAGTLGGAILIGIDLEIFIASRL